MISVDHWIHPPVFLLVWKLKSPLIMYAPAFL